MHKKPLILALLTGIALSGVAQAALHDRGSGLIYDDVLNLTWLQDANYAATQYANSVGTLGDSDGLMNWTVANAWAANLVYHDSVRNVDYSDWRLPTMVDTGALGCNIANIGTDCGMNVQTVSGSTIYSEMAHMYFNNLGLKSYRSPTGAVQSDFGLFGNGTSGIQNNVGLIHNLQGYMYWSNLGMATTNLSSAWTFDPYYGFQYGDPKTNEHFAWAVTFGDVAAAPVPEPETYALMLAGLGLVGWAAKRRRG